MVNSSDSNKSNSSSSNSSGKTRSEKTKSIPLPSAKEPRVHRFGDSADFSETPTKE